MNEAENYYKKQVSRYFKQHKNITPSRLHKYGSLIAKEIFQETECPCTNYKIWICDCPCCMKLKSTYTEQGTK